MGWYVIVGTLPIGVLGFLLRHQIETAARDLRLIAGYGSSQPRFRPARGAGRQLRTFRAASCFNNG